MNRKYRIALLPLLFCLAAALPAWGSREKEPVVEVTGRVRLVGTGTLPELVISGPDKEWYIDREEQHKFMELQHRIITVKANESVREIVFAGGQSGGERRTLKKIKLISIE